MTFAPSELILNTDGSIYHLGLQPDQLADWVITVGDPERVERVSRHFDRIDHRIAKREFHTHTGELNGLRLTVISTGIGTDNIDIVLNELDALARLDLQQRKLLPESDQRQLRLIRVGTSGAVQPSLDLDTFLLSTAAVGLDGLMPFYELDWPSSTRHCRDSLDAYLASLGLQLPGSPYLAEADHQLVELFAAGDIAQGITLTAAGFYGPQARQIRLRSRLTEQLMAALTGWTYERQGYPGRQITNFEMETAGLFGLAYALGHRAVGISALLANRANTTFSTQPGKTVDRLIEWVLDRLAGSSCT